MEEIAYQNKDIISKALAENLENKSIQTFLLSGLLVFSDKILDNRMEEAIGRWM